MTDFTKWVAKNKALWTRVYDEVIQPDLETEWKKREELHAEELKEKEENQQHLFEHLNKEIVEKAHLSRENERLRKELHNHESAAISSSNHADMSGIDTALPGPELRNLTDKYEELSRKYQDLSQKAKYLEKKNASVMQKNKEMKENVRAWQEYADRQAEKHKQKLENKVEDARLRLLTEDRPHMPSSLGSVSALATPRAAANREGSSPEITSPLPQPAATVSNRLATPEQVERGGLSLHSTSVTPRASGHDRLGDYLAQDNQTYDQTPSSHLERDSSRDAPLAHVQMLSGHLNSSQTTVDEPMEQANALAPATDAIDDDDFPQFVSERNLKRKRGQPSRSRFEIYAERSSGGTPVKSFRVKEEQQSSPPTTNTGLARTETFDLDDPAPNVLQTPHHPRRTLSTCSSSNGTSSVQRSNSTPFSQTVSRDFTATDNSNNQVPLNMTKAMIAEARSLSEPIDPLPGMANALQSLDPNIVSSAPDEPPAKRSKAAKPRRSERYSVLAESGENSPPVDDELRIPPSAARASLTRKLLASRSPQSHMTSISRTSNVPSPIVKVEQLETPPTSVSRYERTPATRSTDRAQKSKSRSAPRDEPIPSGPIWTLGSSESRPSAQKTRASASKRSGNLKDKHWTDLTLQNFRPNPAYNQGYTYAFSETVRNRADRLCLPGCTNPQCCGSTFRVLAEAQAPLSASEEEALLQEYLGDACDNMRLTQMSTEERKELVLQARTTKMARETGKHREAYERRKEPPGFWRVDFPTTQEQQEDRKRAKEEERVEVHQRWLEAQRKGGRWIFRDE